MNWELLDELGRRVSATLRWSIETLARANEEDGGTNVSLEYNDRYGYIDFKFVDLDGGRSRVRFDVGNTK